MEREISGYYFDGEKSWILYKDEHGNETMEEDKEGYIMAKKRQKVQSIRFCDRFKKNIFFSRK